MRRSRKFIVASCAILFVLTAGVCGWIWLAHGAYGFGVLLRRGGTYWVDMPRNDPRLPLAMRLAVSDRPPKAEAGSFTWSQVEPGFETTEIPVLVDGEEVDRILLSRIDPRRFRFVVRNAPSGEKDIEGWAQTFPEAVLIVNGSYFDAKGHPDTPIVSGGQPAGPSNYDARGGAFVDNGGSAQIVDLAGKNWKIEFANARNAMVSYPLLIDSQGQTRTGPDSRWLSNRTFLAQDHAGRVLVGTTEAAFFSLARLAVFLKALPLNLHLALNLDGGPIACRSMHLDGTKQVFYARWESQFHNGHVSLLRSVAPSVPWGMPMALIVERR